MTGAEGAIISAFARLVPIILPLILSKIEEVLKKREDLQGLVSSLRNLLSTIQANILESRKTPRSRNGTSQPVETFIANLRCFAYDMEDCIDGYEAKTLKGVKLYDKITELKTHLSDLITLHKQLSDSITQQGASSPRTSTPTNSNTSHSLADLLAGSNVDAKPLHDVLFQSGGSHEAKVIVISVVGFGDLVKTNLCKQVYDEMLSKNRFSRHIFVCAAGKDRNKILEEIILTLSDQGSDQNIVRRGVAAVGRKFVNIIGQKAQVGIGGNANGYTQPHQVKEYMDKLTKCLAHSSYLIAVDKVESEELGKFISCAFPQSNDGSRIIMAMNVPSSTSQSGDCQRQVSTTVGKPRHQFQIVGSSPSSMSLLMLMLSRGLPHALVSISGVLMRRCISPYDVDEAWRQFRTEEGDCWRENMPIVLRHCYDSLPARGCRSYVSLYIPDPQACLLYFAMFPRGNNVKRASLIRRWLAEGQQLGGTSSNAAKNMDLIDGNFIRPLHVSLNHDQYFKTCQPPEEVIGYITEKSEEEEFIKLSHEVACSASLNFTRRLSLHPTDVPNGSRRRRDPTDDDASLPPRLRSLAVSSSTNASSIVKCEQLRVLDMEEYRGLEDSQLYKICKKLILLRYLSLRPDRITKVPSSISNLQHLATLDFVKDNEKVVLLPIVVLELPCLKNLLGMFMLKDSIIPNRFLGASHKIKRSRLERIAGFVTRKGHGFPPLMCHMKHLWKVKIWFRRDADAKSLTSFLPAAIGNFLKGDRADLSLSLDFHEYDCPNPGELLKSLDKAKGKLYSLKLCARNLSEIPMFVTNNLTGITKLCLSWGTITLDASFLNDLSKLNQLKYLKLVADTVEGAYGETPQAENNNNQAKLIIIKTTHLQNVKQMWLVSKSRLPEILIEPGTLKKLVSIHLISEDLNCPSANVLRNTDHHRQANSPFQNLMEVTLNAAVSSQTKKDWHQAARDHHNCPRVLFIRHPHPRHAG